VGSYFFFDGSILSFIRVWFLIGSYIWVTKTLLYYITTSDSDSLVYLEEQLGTYENVLGTVSLHDSLKIKRKKHLLQNK
jgi:hypothetical protein